MRLNNIVSALLLGYFIGRDSKAREIQKEYNRMLIIRRHGGIVNKIKIYDEEPKKFLNVYRKYMNYELSVEDAAKELNMSVAIFRKAIRYYRDKKNIPDKKSSYPPNNISKYKIYDKDPERFLEVYNKYKNKEIIGEVAAKELNMSVSAFYKAINYYKSKIQD